MNKRLGETRKNNFGTDMKIIRYKNSEDMDVQFLDGNYYVFQHTTYPNFKNGCIKNPYDRSVFGIGYVGDGKYQTKINGKRVRAYNVWHEMVARCHEESRSYKYGSYYDICSVCSEWMCYNTFAHWYEQNKYECDGRLHLDKDILYPGNKVYSPYTCLLVPQRINMLFSNKPNKRGLPNGISKLESGYSAKYRGEELGVYDTLEEAYKNYASKKEENIKQVADEYKNVIPKNVYDALYRYKVDIRNDKNYVAA